MTTIGDQVTRARKSAHLDVPMFARLAELDPGRAEAIERGTDEATTDELDRCARVFGVRVRDLIAGEARSTPMAMLLRSAFDEGRTSLDTLAETGAIRELGSFQRCVREIAELEGLVGSPPLRLPTGHAYPGDPEREAKSVRLRLGLGLEPIANMRALLEGLGVRLFFTDPDRLDPQIDGAVTDIPRPAILVNLVGGGECSWRTRMTLAHEFAHLLFDVGDHHTLFSPHLPSGARARPTARWRLFDAFEDIEVRADAFAACFLAPGQAVRELVRGVEPTSEDAIVRVGSTFGVGRTVAINRLQHSFGLSPDQRVAMETRETRRRWQASFAGDVVPDGEGLRDGVLRDVVAEALRRDKIGRVRAWEILGVPLTQALPVGGLPEATSAAIVDQDDRLRFAALKYLAERYPALELTAGAVVREGGGWSVSVLRGEAGERHPRDLGTVLLSDEAIVVQERFAVPKA